MAELQRIAAESVAADHCVEIEKLAEGSFNKIFRLVMDNGAVAIARVPNPNAGPPYFTTASEVATIDFVNIYELPEIHRLALTRSSGSDNTRSSRTKGCCLECESR